MIATVIVMIWLCLGVFLVCSCAKNGNLYEPPQDDVGTVIFAIMVLTILAPFIVMFYGVKYCWENKI